jgi:3-hydroxyisobutyrate dehydrogenase-like beta-hydroxyacid dehydrogenase
MREPVGLIGLGLLGSALADRLITGGFPVTGFDTDPERLQSAVRCGVSAARSGAEVAARCPCVLTCLPDGPTTSAAVLQGGIAAAARPGAVLIDCCTCAPDESRSLAEALTRCGIEMLDAPVSGSSAVVRAGGALIMVGGATGTLARCRPVLEAIAPQVLLMGPQGAGVTAKLVSNLVLGINRLALAEGLALAERAGVDLRRMLAVLRDGAAYSRVVDAKGERMIDRQYQPEARLRQHLKDVELILRVGRDVGASMPASEVHHRLLLQAVSLGFGESDNSAVIEALRLSVLPKLED